MSQAIILLISEEEDLRETVGRAVGGVGDLVLQTYPNTQSAYQEFGKEELALVLVHLTARDDSSTIPFVMQGLAASGQAVAVVTLCDELAPQQLLMMLRAGVADCLPRPLDINRLVFHINQLTVRKRFTLKSNQANSKGTPKESPPSTPPASAGQASSVPGGNSSVPRRSPSKEIIRVGKARPFLYHEEEMGAMMVDVHTVATQDTTVLITGETGTGKTELANLIHELSDRKGHPFVTVNCGSLSANLIESEMFGHLRGAFTGAERDRSGRFTEAGEGTLFLDDVDALPLESQAKLLRALEERVFEAVGSDKTLPLKARIITATNQNLPQLVEEGTFREDLYYRLCVVDFPLAPLRKRPLLLEPLCEKFIQQIAGRNNRQPPKLAEDTLVLLQNYHWPGNIRELRNVVERAVSLCRGSEILAENLPEHLRNPQPDSVLDFPSSTSIYSEFSDSTSSSTSIPTTLGKAIDEAERESIERALANNANNRSKAASELGISRVTLYKKMRKYGLH
ncbi:Phage shock protein operon transcriptional activator [Planctomycetales bacterium 10988]|nr:Phage shock protein operon transcriptional activator [Planctomycetales bacterium 10988]